MEKTNPIFTQLTTKYPDISEDELTTIIENMEAQISQFIDIPIKPTSFTQIERNYNGNSIIIDRPPVKEIHSLHIDNECIQSSDYTLDHEAGILYLHQVHKGNFLRLQYISGLTNTAYELYILPLLLDMIDYNFDMNWVKDASSIKEGDVTVNFDTSVGKGALIQKKLEELRNQFRAYARMI